MFFQLHHSMDDNMELEKFLDNPYIGVPLDFFVSSFGLLPESSMEFLFVSFIWLNPVLVVACGAQCSCSCSGFWACRLSSCGTWVLEYVGSVIVACRLSYSTPCVILVPDQGPDHIPALKGGFLAETTREVLQSSFGKLGFVFWLLTLLGSWSWANPWFFQTSVYSFFK